MGGVHSVGEHVDRYAEPEDFIDWEVEVFTDADLLDCIKPALTCRDLVTLARASKRCAVAIRPLLEEDKRAHLSSIYKYWKGATPSFVEGAYYEMNCDYYKDGCYYEDNVLVPMLTKFGSAFCPTLYNYGRDDYLLCTKVTTETCTFQFSRLAMGELVVPMHALKWLCFAEIDASEGIVVLWQSGYTLSSDSDDDALDHRWHFQRDDRNGINAGYDPNRTAPHAAQLVELHAWEVSMTSTELAVAIAQLRGPVYRPPLTKKDAPTYCQVRRKLLVPAFRELRLFGVTCAHNNLKCTWRDVEQTEDGDEGAYVAYLEDNYQFHNDDPFGQGMCLDSHLGDYKRCRARAVLERAGFVLKWDDSNDDVIRLRLWKGDEPYDVSDNGYESGESEYDSYSDLEEGEEEEESKEEEEESEEEEEGENE